MAAERFLAAVALAACAHQPAPTGLDRSTLREVASKIVLCQTREDELRQRLGPPFRDGRIAQGRVVSWLPAPDSVSTHYLAVLVRDGLVVDLYYDVPSELVWAPVDRCAPVR